MGWTGFVVKMNDGTMFPFGTSFLFDFFDLPNGYSASDIKEIINHSYISTGGKLQKHSVPFFEPPKNYDRTIIFREKPYFNCYIKEL